MTNNVDENYLQQMAEAIDGTLKQTLGEGGCGFIFVTVTEAQDGSTDVNYISNLSKGSDVKEILTGLVTMDETKN